MTIHTKNRSDATVRTLRTILGLLLMLTCSGMVFFIYTSTAYYQADAKTSNAWLFVLLSLLQLFGYGFVLLLFGFMILGYKFVRHQMVTARHVIVGIVVTLFASSILFDLHFIGSAIGIQSGGGTLGEILTSSLVELLSLDLLTLLCTALLVYGFVLITRMPIVRIFEDIGFVALNYKKETALAIFTSYFQPTHSTRRTYNTEATTGGQRNAMTNAIQNDDSHDHHTPDITNLKAPYTDSATDHLFAYTKNSDLGSQTQQFPEITPDKTAPEVPEETTPEMSQLTEQEATVLSDVHDTTESQVIAATIDAETATMPSTAPPDTTPDAPLPDAPVDMTSPEVEKKKLELNADNTQATANTHIENDACQLSLAEHDSVEQTNSSESDVFMLTDDSKNTSSSYSAALANADESSLANIAQRDDETQIISVPKELRHAVYQKAHAQKSNQQAYITADEDENDSVYGNLNTEVQQAIQDQEPLLPESMTGYETQQSAADGDTDDVGDFDGKEYTDTTSHAVVKKNNAPCATESPVEPNIELETNGTDAHSSTNNNQQLYLDIDKTLHSRTTTQNAEQLFVYPNEFDTDDQDGSYTREVKKAVQALMDDFAQPATWQTEDNTADEQPSVADQPVAIVWEMPTTKLLGKTDATESESAASLTQMAELLHGKLAEFGIDIEVKEMVMGPTVSLFSILPAPGIKVSRIQALDRDLARALSVKSVRIVDIIPGKPYVGIEVPNKTRTTVRLRDIVDEMKQSQAEPLSFALGKDIAGHTIVANLMKMPHLLIAGTTGSGKSVGIHSIVLSMLCLYTPEQLRLILVDPKMLELSFYRDIPHLYMPVISDMPKAIKAFDWCVGEMERRYQLMAAVNVRNIETLNVQIAQAIQMPNSEQDPIIYVDGEQMRLSSQRQIPYIAVVIDEFADMVMTLGKKAEEAIVRLAQKARASGIHLILATQRPSVDVITGLIKANVPSRLSFMVSSKVDSRTVLDESGAEQLLGHGDMLFVPVGETIPRRVQGAFVSEKEIDAVCEHWRFQQQEACDMVNLSRHDDNQDDDLDELYTEVYELITSNNKVESISALQRRYSIGYNRAARILEQLEAKGIVSTPSQSGRRQLLV